MSAGSLSGWVKFKGGDAGVPVGTVALSPAALAPTQLVDGGYLFEDLPIGVYAVTATVPPFGAATGTVSIIAGGAASLDLVVQNWRPESAVCLTCHETLDAQLVADYKASKMAPSVSCQDCHGTNVTGAPKHNPRPTPEQCAVCHPDQYRGHQSNRHSIGMQRTFESGRLDDLPPCVGGDVMSGGVANCTSCHQVESSCDSCHSRHLFDSKQARAPQSCATCHMGPDHAQWEMYSTSKHGVLNAARGDQVAPGCAGCHMGQKRVNDAGTKYTDHDLSFGIAWGPVGGRASHMSFKRGGQFPYVLNGSTLSPNPAFDPTAPYDMTGADGVPDSQLPGDRDGVVLQAADPAPVLAARRNEMLKTCDACHARSFATYRLEVADGMHHNATEVVADAEDIVRAVNFDGLVMPPTPMRPQNPDGPAGLILGGPMLYRNLSPIERTYFKMYKYDYVKTWQGAYHLNPDYSHWYGWAELNLDLSDIAGEAYRLRRDAALVYAITNGLNTVWNVPYQGVVYQTGSMTKSYDLYAPDSGMVVDSYGSGSPITYDGGFVFH